MLPHVLRALRREPAVAITLAYLLVAMAGIYTTTGSSVPSASRC